MTSRTCEIMRLGSDLARTGLNVQVVSNGQSIQPTCAAMVATYYWALWQKAANANGKISADGHMVEVWHV